MDVQAAVAPVYGACMLRDAAGAAHLAAQRRVVLLHVRDRRLPVRAIERLKLNGSIPSVSVAQLRVVAIHPPAMAYTAGRIPEYELPLGPRIIVLHDGHEQVARSAEDDLAVLAFRQSNLRRIVHVEIDVRGDQRAVCENTAGTNLEVGCVCALRSPIHHQRVPGEIEGAARRNASAVVAGSALGNAEDRVAIKQRIGAATPKIHFAARVAHHKLGVAAESLATIIADVFRAVIGGGERRGVVDERCAGVDMRPLLRIVLLPKPIPRRAPEASLLDLDGAFVARKVGIHLQCAVADLHDRPGLQIAAVEGRDGIGGAVLRVVRCYRLRKRIGGSLWNR